MAEKEKKYLRVLVKAKHFCESFSLIVYDLMWNTSSEINFIWLIDCYVACKGSM